MKNFKKINEIAVKIPTLKLDKTKYGWYCSMCNKFSKNPNMIQGKRWIYKKNNEKWLVNAHYDGCRGWD